MAQFIALFLLVGVALFRSLRYRLSRTYWRGIRGGRADPLRTVHAETRLSNVSPVAAERSASA